MSESAPGVLTPRDSPFPRPWRPVTTGRMDVLDLTLGSPHENLALDEALLDEAEGLSEPTETLRFWEASTPAVIVGRASRVADEVDVDHCHQHGIPILRRCSGGTAVVVLPGCLVYAVVLHLALRPQLRSIDQAHGFVLSQLQRALAGLDISSRQQGTSDVTCGSRKVSGNSLRYKQHALLYHGTLLYRADMDLIDKCLRLPPRQPEYRQGRPHRQFVANLDVAAGDLRQMLATAWQVQAARGSWPRDRVRQLVVEKYSQANWNLRR